MKIMIIKKKKKLFGLSHYPYIPYLSRIGTGNMYYFKTHFNESI